ncbi:hypothetical protein GGI35DRAFT_298387 [Trichoderma velutinum]
MGSGGSRSRRLEPRTGREHHGISDTWECNTMYSFIHSFQTARVPFLLLFFLSFPNHDKLGLWSGWLVPNPAPYSAPYPAHSVLTVRYANLLAIVSIDGWIFIQILSRTR